MPFTFSHPAIVLPFLNKRYFSATALIAGSLSPDFEYFLKMSAGGEHGHTLAGIFYFDLPVTIVITFIFHYIIREPLLQNLPVHCQSRLGLLRSVELRNYVFKDYMIFIVSAIIGACSHVFWDSFTHNGGLMVKHIAFLRDYYVPLNGARYPGKSLLKNK